MSEKILIGNVSKAQGIKGEVKVTLLSSEKDIFKKLKKVYLNDKLYQVESVKNLANGIFFKLVGVDDRNSAELLRGASITCEKEDMPKLPKGRYLVSDIIGCTVSVDGVEIGSIYDILQNGSADVYCVKGEHNHKNFMFPCLKKVLVNVDIDSKNIDLDREILEQIAVYED